MERVTDQGINILDFVGVPVNSEDCLKAEELLKMNYGVDYPKEKFSMLWEMILEEKWSSERLKQTLKWFLKNKRFPNWTIADWFDYQVKLYPYTWYIEQVNKFGAKANKMIESYKINGKILFRYSDGSVLPFEYLGFIE